MEPTPTLSAVSRPTSVGSLRPHVFAVHVGGQAVRQVHELLMVDEDFRLCL